MCEEVKDPKFAKEWEEREASQMELEETLEPADDKWLKLEFDDTVVGFIIRGLRRGGEYDNWFTTELTIQNQYFNYSSSGEVIMLEEMHSLMNSIKELLDGKLHEKAEIVFIEPDFEFLLTPIVNLGECKNTVIVGKDEAMPDFKNVQHDGITQYVREGYEIIDIDMVLRINLHSKGYYNGQQYTIPFSRPDIERIYEYLAQSMEQYPLEESG